MTGGNGKVVVLESNPKVEEYFICRFGGRAPRE